MKLPIIDLGAKYLIIDDSGSVPKWKKIGTGPSSAANAIKVAKKQGCSGFVWIDDGFEKRMIKIE